MLMNSGIRFLIVTLVVVLLLVFGIVIINRNGAGGGRAPVASYNVTKLADSQGSTVASYVDGPINAAEAHRAVRLTVSAKTRQIDVIAGYEGKVIDTKTYENNADAYNEFLQALNRANFTRERKISNISADAVCPLGNRTHYRIVENGDLKQNSWTASCTGGTFGGNISLTNSLFRAQFPDYNQMTSGMSLNNTPASTGLVL